MRMKEKGINYSFDLRTDGKKGSFVGIKYNYNGEYGFDSDDEKEEKEEKEEIDYKKMYEDLLIKYNDLINERKNPETTEPTTADIKVNPDGFISINKEPKKSKSKFNKWQETNKGISLNDF